VALQIDLADSNVGIPVPKAYLRIVGFGYDILTNKLQVAVNAYISEAASRAGKSPVTGVVLNGEMQKDFLPIMETGGRALLYRWIKSQQAFASAIDLLDNDSGAPVSPDEAQMAPVVVQGGNDVPAASQLPS